MLTLNPDRRSRQARSSRPRATVRAEGRKEVRYGPRTTTLPITPPIWVGRTCYMGGVYRHAQQARNGYVNRTLRALNDYRQSVGSFPSTVLVSGVDFRVGIPWPQAKDVHLTPEQRAHEAALQQRYTDTKLALYKWEKRTGKPQRVRSLIG